MEGGDISMSSIDSRVVAMKFDNAQFEQGIKSTLNSLTNLKTGLKLDGATQGLDNISTAASRGLSLSNITSSLDNISSKFSAMSVIAITALTNIANKAINVGTNFAKSLTIAPITTGMSEYETKLTSIQTILANTQAMGTNLGDVSGALNELNTYSDQTIYNFGEMAKNIGTFTAAGVDLKTSTSSIKGIANLAALSGSNSQQASTAMYQLSQAISEGKVSLESWNSVTNAGMGGTIFKKSLAETAVAMGTLSKDAVKTVDKMGNVTVNGKAFRESIMAKPGETSWLTSKVLTTALGNFTGDLKDADLAAQGFSKSQIVAIQKQAATAKQAATVVKTGTQLVGVLQEAAQSGWAASWELVAGDFNEAPKMWTNVNNAIGKIVGDSATARNKVIGDWKTAGGRTALIDSFSYAFKALMTVIAPIKEAFRSIFPATTGKELFNLTITLRNFMASLQLGAANADKLKRTFAGVFAALSIGWQVIKAGINMFANLFGNATKGGSGILDFTAKIGDWLVKVNAAVKKGDDLSKFFGKLGSIIAVPITILKTFAGLIGSAFGGLGDKVDTSKLDKLHKKFEPLGALGNAIIKVWSGIGKFLAAAALIFEPIATKFTSFFQGFGKKIQDSFKNVDYNKVLDGINTGLLAGIVLLLHKFIKNGMNINVGSEAGGGFLSSIKEAFGGVTDTMKAMQANLKANVLIKIAAAVALLTISVVALSMIDSKKLTTALVAIGAMMAQLMIAMEIFSKISSMKGSAKMAIIGAGLILLAIAIDILAVAVTKLAKLSWAELAKGLVGVTVLVGALILAVKGMSSKDSTKMISTGIGLTIMAVAIRILVSAVKDMADMSWEQLSKGLAGVGGILAALTFFTKFSGADKGGISSGAGILLMAFGIKILAGALKDMGSMSWEVIGKGLATLGGALLAIGIALKLIPPSSILSAAAVLVVATSLGLIGNALKAMGSMSWEVIGKGMVSLGGALGIIAIALALLPPSTLLSAAAIFIVATSLGLIATALGTMGGMSWEEIGKGLIVLAASLGIIAIAMYAMQSALPGALALIIVAGSLAILAPILTTFGKMSWEEIGKGLTMLAGVFLILGVAGLVLTPVVGTILLLGIAVGLLGVGILAAGAGILLFSVGLTAIALAGAAATVAVVGIVSGLIGLIPMVLTQIGIGIVAFAQVIAMSGPAITMAITTVLLALIQAIATLAPVIVLTLLTIIMQMLTGLANAVPAMVSAGFRIIKGFLQGIADNIGGVVTLVADIIVNFLNAIANALPRIIAAGVNVVVKFLEGIGSPDNIKSILDAAAEVIVNFVNGISTAIDDHAEEIGIAAGKLAVALGRGLKNGIGGAIREVAKGVDGPVGLLLNKMADAMGVKSPSTKTYAMGVYLGQGLSNGLDAYAGVAAKSAEGVGHGAIDSMRKSISGMSDLIANDITVNPTITPVLDLTSMQKDAQGIDAMLSTKPISVGATYSQATSASTGYGNTKTAIAQSAGQTSTDIKALTAAISAVKPNANGQTPVAPRPVQFHIGTVQDGDSLLQRARATDKMLSLAEGGDSPQMVGIGI
jgi:tape measure domain-containing protein